MVKYVVAWTSVWTLMACSENPVRSEPEKQVHLAQLLDQIDEAIQSARSVDKKVPSIESVQLDLQMATVDSIDGSLPILFITPSVQRDHETTHSLSLTFAPKNQSNAPPADKSKMSKLASAITLINEAVIKAQEKYQFQRGSIRLECTMDTQVGVDATIGKLVPIGVGASHSKEQVQSITLNFAPPEQAGQEPANSFPSSLPVEAPAKTLKAKKPAAAKLLK